MVKTGYEYLVVKGDVQYTFDNLDEAIVKAKELKVPGTRIVNNGTPLNYITTEYI